MIKPITSRYQVVLIRRLSLVIGLRSWQPSIGVSSLYTTFRKPNLLSTFSKYYSQSSSIVPFSQFLVTCTLRIFLISPRSLVLKQALSYLQNQSRLELFSTIAARLLTYTKSLISRSTWTNKQGLALLCQKPYFVSLVFIKRFQSYTNYLRL